MKAFNKRTKKYISFFLIFLMVTYTSSCNYYKLNEVDPYDAPSIQNIGQLYKTMVVHYGDETFLLQDITVDSLSLSGRLAEATPTDFYYSEANKNMRFKSKEKEILQEVHFYISGDQIQPPLAQIPLEDIKEIRIIEPDSGRTIASYVFTTVGVLVGVFAILLVIVALTKSSCPYVYVYDGETYIFEGETFGGAIAQNLERDDYMPLPNIRDDHGQYKIRISNELKEVQYTDLAQLIVVNHPKKSEVILDKKGIPHLLFDKTEASVAMSERGENLLPTLGIKDQNVFFFNEFNATSNAVFLTFDKPEDAAQSKLVLSAKNTLWFDYIFGEFLSKFGSAYSTWMQKQSTMSGEERLKKISDNNFPLSIYVKKNNKWQLVEEIMTVGPLAYRDFVVPIDLSNISDHKVEVKIETGFMFWELDAATMSFSSDIAMDVEIVKPTFANGTGAKDWTRSLMYADKDYMVQPSPGNITEITYKSSTPRPDNLQSVFLHTRGYYTLVRDFTGVPEISELNKFKTPGHFSLYSKTNYLNMLDKEDNLFCVTSQN
jgi:hypothetical protein